MDRSILFTPLSLKRITLPGRLIRSATELFGSTSDAHVRPVEIEIYRRLGREPLGMILTSHTCVSPEGRSNPYQNAVWDDAYLPDAEAIAQAGGAEGVPVVMQIGHGGMKAEGNNGGLPVFTPDAMTHEQIRSLVRAFGEAALRARRAGMAGIMLHGAHLYLLSQFFYPKFNHRTDAYGGSALNRFRILREIMEEVRTVRKVELIGFKQELEFNTDIAVGDRFQIQNGVWEGVTGWLTCRDKKFKWTVQIEFVNQTVTTTIDPSKFKMIKLD